MAIAKWGAPDARSSNLAGTAFNSLANGSESAGITYANNTARQINATVCIKLGSITPSNGGSVTLRHYPGDGTDQADIGGGSESYTWTLASGASAKVVVIPMVRMYPFSNARFTLVNNSGVTLNASGNELYVTAYPEDVT